MYKLGIFRMIDRYWTENGLFAYIPAPMHYTVVMMAVCIPFAWLFSCICCSVSDEDNEKAKVAEGKAD